MIKRTANSTDTEPEESKFPVPSEDREHLFQVVDKWQSDKDPDVIVTKLEVVGGDEEGRSILHNVNTNDQHKGFYYARLFLKAIGEPYKGQFSIDDDNWPGRQFYATVVHNGKYANIDAYNFDKKVEQVNLGVSNTQKTDTVAWDE